jgi:hypothetical protein
VLLHFDGAPEHAARDKVLSERLFFPIQAQGDLHRAFLLFDV